MLAMNGEVAELCEGSDPFLVARTSGLQQLVGSALN